MALATVVSVVGSAPRGLGATLAVTPDEEIAGSVSGGCVEPAVIEEEMRAMRTGRTRLLQFGITEEQNVERIGLSCGGEIRVFVEPFPPEEVAAPLLRALDEGASAARAVVISVDGADAALVGRQVLQLDGPDGALIGTLGDERLDAAAREQLAIAARTGTPSTSSVHLGEDATAEVFVAPYVAPPLLVIVGAGHVSIPLSRLAKVLGYRVVVVDARAAFATRDRLPDADEILVEWPDEALARLRLQPTTAVAVLTHDNKFDVPALKVALASPAGYVGAIGSRGTREARNQRLREEGIPEERIARIHGPIGLDIGAERPEEIALAILAQIVAARRGKALTAVR